MNTLILIYFCVITAFIALMVYDTVKLIIKNDSITELSNKIAKLESQIKLIKD